MIVVDVVSMFWIGYAAGIASLLAVSFVATLVLTRPAEDDHALDKG